MEFTLVGRPVRRPARDRMALAQEAGVDVNGPFRLRGEAFL